MYYYYSSIVYYNYVFNNYYSFISHYLNSISVFFILYKQVQLLEETRISKLPFTRKQFTLKPLI